MAAGDRIFMAKESTSQEILSNTKKIIEDAKAKPKRYGMRINLLDSNPAIGVRPCPVRWQPWQRVEVRFVVLECEQPCDEREHEHRGEPILSNYGAFNQKHTFFLHRRVLKYT